MSGVGHKLTRRAQIGMSALLPKAAAAVSNRRVRLGHKRASEAAYPERHKVASQNDLVG